MKNKGLLHVYTGDGKGKTTAAVGLAIRAVGSGMKVGFFQFLKGIDSSEIRVLEKAGIEVHKPNQPKDFTWAMDEKTQAISKEINRQTFAYANANLYRFDLVVLDEIFACLHAGYITEPELLALLSEKPAETELVLTGRNAPTSVTSLADYVTEMKLIKHPFNEGIDARKGIEF